MLKNKSLLNLSKQLINRRRKKAAWLISTLNKNLETEDNNIENVEEKTTELNFSDDESALSDLDSDDDVNEPVNEPVDPEKFLRQWYFKNDVSQKALNEILLFLKNNAWLNLPADSRTLLRTPKETAVVPVSPGNYVHIGLKTSLDLLFATLQDKPSKLLLDFNIDGVPISKSSSSGFWLILARRAFF